MLGIEPSMILSNHNDSDQREERIGAAGGGSQATGSEINGREQIVN